MRDLYSDLKAIEDRGKRKDKDSKPFWKRRN